MRLMSINFLDQFGDWNKRYIKLIQYRADIGIRVLEPIKAINNKMINECENLECPLYDILCKNLKCPLYDILCNSQINLSNVIHEK